MDPSLRAHSEANGEAIQKQHLDCFVALLLAMTRALDQFGETALGAQSWQVPSIPKFVPGLRRAVASFGIGTLAIRQGFSRQHCCGPIAAGCSRMRLNSAEIC